VVCRDGDNIAIAVIGQGCLRSKGLGFCIMDNHGLEPRMPGISLLCSSGSAYFLSTGSSIQAECRRRDSEMTCMDQVGGFASANCTIGCDSVKAGGVCCMSGTQACPPVVVPERRSR
jgi:hypothetical protein